MTRPRDSQRAKLYRAEDAVFQKSKPAEYTDLRDVQAYADKVLKSKWVRRTFPHAPYLVRVVDGRGRRRAAAFRGSNRIAMPRWSRSRWTVLHELAHIFTPGHFAAHGREYAATYLLLVRHFLGTAAHAELRASFKEHRVKYTKKRTVTL